jgi:hypothetical protein
MPTCTGGARDHLTRRGLICVDELGSLGVRRETVRRPALVLTRDEAPEFLSRS